MAKSISARRLILLAVVSLIALYTLRSFQVMTVLDNLPPISGGQGLAAKAEESAANTKSAGAVPVVVAENTPALSFMPSPPSRSPGSPLPHSSIDIRAGSCITQTARLEPRLSPDCPKDKFLVFRPYSGMNNAIRQVVAASLMAKRLGRTVLLTDNFGFDWGLFDFGSLCVERASDRRIDELRDASPHSDYTFEIPLFSDKHFMHDIGCVVDNVAKSKAMENPLLSFSQVFFTSIVKESYMDALKHLNFASSIRDVGDKFMRESFGDEKFVGVHIRWFGGECFDQMKNLFVKGLAPYHSDAINACGVTWSYIERMMLAHGYDPDQTKILLASDGEQPYIVRHLTERKNVYQLKADHAGAMVDMYMLSKSALFLGNPYSSLTFHVALWREIGGHSSASNAIPGYVETGYLHHMFLPGPHGLIQ